MLTGRGSFRRTHGRWLFLLLSGALVLGCGGQVNETVQTATDAGPEVSTLNDASPPTDATAPDGLTDARIGDGSTDRWMDAGPDASLGPNSIATTAGMPTVYWAGGGVKFALK